MNNRRSNEDYPEHLNPFKSRGLRGSFRELKRTFDIKFRRKEPKRNLDDSRVHATDVGKNSEEHTESNVTLRAHGGTVHQQQHKSEMYPRSRFHERANRAQTMAPTKVDNPFGDVEENNNEEKCCKPSNESSETTHLTKIDNQKPIKKKRRKKRAPLPPGRSGGSTSDLNQSQWSLSSYDTDYSSAAYYSETTQDEHEHEPESTKSYNNRLNEINEISSEIISYCNNIDDSENVTEEAEHVLIKQKAVDNNNDIHENVDDNENDIDEAENALIKKIAAGDGGINNKEDDDNDNKNSSNESVLEEKVGDHLNNENVTDEGKNIEFKKNTVVVGTSIKNEAAAADINNYNVSVLKTKVADNLNNVPPENTSKNLQKEIVELEQKSEHLQKEIAELEQKTEGSEARYIEFENKSEAQEIVVESSGNHQVDLEAAINDDYCNEAMSKTEKTELTVENDKEEERSIDETSSKLNESVLNSKNRDEHTIDEVVFNSKNKDEHNIDELVLNSKNKNDSKYIQTKSLYITGSCDELDISEPIMYKQKASIDILGSCDQLEKH